MHVCTSVSCAVLSLEPTRFFSPSNNDNLVIEEEEEVLTPTPSSPGDDMAVTVSVGPCVILLEKRTGINEMTCNTWSITSTPMVIKASLATFMLISMEFFGLLLIDKYTYMYVS